MPRSTIRSAVVSYLQNAGITNLSTVKGHPARFTGDMEFFAGEDPGHSTGAIVYVYIENASETRIALGGAHNGRKAVEYTVVLDCFLRSVKNRSEEVGQDNDDFLDSLVAAIRADRQAGAPSVIFQWGEGVMPGSADITVTSYYPRVLTGGNATLQVYSTVRVQVVEILNT